MAFSNKKREHLVVDTGAFLRLKKFHLFNYETVSTVEGVIGEIRDEMSRRHLEFQMQYPDVLAPTEQDIKFVRSFATKTGDIGFLSETDIHLIALTYMLQRLTGDVSRLKSKPEIIIQKTSVHQNTEKELWTGLLKKIQSTKSNEKQKTSGSTIPSVRSSDSQNDQQNKLENVQIESSFKSKALLPEITVSVETDFNLCKKDHETTVKTYGKNFSVNDKKETLSEAESHVLEKVANMTIAEVHDTESDMSENDDDGEGWLSLENIDTLFGPKVTTDLKMTDSMRVACLTTDYSIQNVLLQMGLSVLSIDGYRINETKNWVLLCRGCRQITWDTTRRFCSYCGNNTVYRAAATLSDDGQLTIYDCRPRFISRGKIYSIPKPKGGRKGDLIICEDQLFIGNREGLYRHNQKKFERERLARNVFNPDNAYEQNGWWPRGQCHRLMKSIQIGLGPGNPNSNRWQKQRRKK